MNKIPIIGLPQVGLPLLIVKAQAKHLCFLLDTGSNINVLDKRVAEFFQLSGRTTQQQQFGIDGSSYNYFVYDLIVLSACYLMGMLFY